MKKSYLTIFGFLTQIIFFPFLIAENKPHELWWERNLVSEDYYTLFANWLDDTKAHSRIAMRDHIKQQGYLSILDVPCGLCIDFFGIQQDQIPIQYTGLDITPQLIKKGKEAGVACFLGSIENIPFSDQSFDIGYARHILEHLDYYENALNELIRVSKKEVLVVFFIKPCDQEEDIINPSIHQEALLYHNQYSQQKLEKFLLQNKRTSFLEWQLVSDKEIILHIYLN